ncbi:bifunctional Glutaredoxin [Babesia duncani]|uniref:Bifunctional Glutaredoxin n=1 Tax=Babesia duncani TaxID=323732 RepID=A0AAD9PNX9_9APIC|nr:bifunctional Glutaredoxin [Babesia duncani]
MALIRHLSQFRGKFFTNVALGVTSSYISCLAGFGPIVNFSGSTCGLGVRGFTSESSVDEDVKQKLKGLIESERILLLLKGSPEDPQCKFSGKMVDILDTYRLNDYAYIDVLSHASLRKCAKELSQWPTFPQLFVRGKLIGGCDIVEELHTTGELGKVLGDESRDSK